MFIIKKKKPITSPQIHTTREATISGGKLKKLIGFMKNLYARIHTNGNAINGSSLETSQEQILYEGTKINIFNKASDGFT